MLTDTVLDHARQLYVDFVTHHTHNSAPDLRKLIANLEAIGMSNMEAQAFVNLGGTSSAEEIARLVGYAQPTPDETPPADRLVIPVGLLEALTARLDALEQRVTELEKHRHLKGMDLHYTSQPKQGYDVVPDWGE